ncbi:HNH endonuclease [Burkholderia cenocepacia]|uniref:HNH endonuclease n=1 Tax=Burkholderia cenocepacia TaxID=95486 RepID=UPI001B961252|nr:HNH endonuclease [Burkholderia cenocepacia]MBR8173094.1 HNH endonuclease [Burkholderia cenocepacia]
MTIQQVLALDIAGTPVEWLSPEEAVTLYARNKVAWELGETEKVFRGGYSRFGIQSEIAIRPIIAIAGSEVMARMLRPELPLGERDNSLLFRRDRNTCAYCAVVFARHHLTRDHIHPQSRGGKSSWQNCAAACRECNGRKGDKLLSECGMELVYLPYVPSRAEHFILSGRNILADQHEYLAANLPRHSRVRLQ